MRDKLANATSQMAQLESERNTLAEAYEELEMKFVKKLESETHRKDVELSKAGDDVRNASRQNSPVFLWMIFVLKMDCVFLYIKR